MKFPKDPPKENGVLELFPNEPKEKGVLDAVAPLAFCAPNWKAPEFCVLLAAGGAAFCAPSPNWKEPEFCVPVAEVGVEA